MKTIISKVKASKSSRKKLINGIKFLFKKLDLPKPRIIEKKSKGGGGNFGYWSSMGGFCLLIFALSSCAPLNLTCSDYAAGKGSHNRQYSNAYKRHFTPHTNFMKSNPMPRI